MSAGRTCVVCRKVVDKPQLLRFVREGVSGGVDEQRLQIDVLQDFPGRGAYCHLDGKCFFDARLPSLLLASLSRVSKGKRRSSKRNVASNAWTLLSEKLLADAVAKVENCSQKQELYNRLRELYEQCTKPVNEPRVGRVRL